MEREPFFNQNYRAWKNNTAKLQSKSEAVVRGLMSVPILPKGLACTAHVDLGIPLSVTIQHCVTLAYPVPFPPYGPHADGVGVVPPIPPDEVVVDFTPILPITSLVVVDKVPDIGDKVRVEVEEVLIGDLVVVEAEVAGEHAGAIISSAAF